MKNTPWTKQELTLLQNETLTSAEVARRIGRSSAAVRGKRGKLRRKLQANGEALAQVKSHVAECAASGDPELVQSAQSHQASFEEDRQRVGGDYWRTQYRGLHQKYERALREQAVVEQLVALARDLAPVSYQPAPNSPNFDSRGPGSPQSAVLLLSDTHVGQVIKPNQTLGYGSYDFPTFLSRLAYLERGVGSIITDHTTTTVDELIVCLGGDMLHGALNHGAEAGQHATLFEQFYGAGHALAQFLRNVKTLAPRVRVYCTVGNHTRWQSQHKMPTENRYSNLDQFLYAYIEALTRDIPGIVWNLDRQPFALFDVQGFRFHLSHGDHLKGGDKALGVPNHAVGRMISSTTQLLGKACEPAPHYYLVGHLHRGIVLPHARGSFLVNGGFPGLDGYGLAGGFSPVDPTQLFFFVHPKFGKTATYDIQLKHATPDDRTHYVLPPAFLPA